MPSAAKDFLPDPSATALPGKAEPQNSPAPNAAGAEIPVTVHASRYSAASKGGGKLPPVHEDTSTVIIFPQGAVVRLSATVTIGELVVLSNKRTGADVICRVTNVKTQPGIQNYVHLEFTQRALDFWEEGAADRGKPLSKPVLGAVPPAAHPASPAVSPSVPQISVPAEPPSPAKAPISVLEPKISVPAVPKTTPLADAPLPAHPFGETPAVAELTAISPAAQKQPEAPVRVPQLRSFEQALPQQKSGSKTIILFAIAAVVLLAIGALGGIVLLRENRGTVEVQQLPSAAAALQVPVARSEAPVASTPPAQSSLQTVASPVSKSSPVEIPVQPAPVRAAAELPRPAAPPQPVSRPSLPVGKISAPRVKTTARLSSEPPPVLPADPAALGQSIISSAARGIPAAPVQPAAPQPVRGGILQQPRLLSSVAASYPALARTQRVQGDVVVDALIDSTGKVAATSVISGNALLQKAAIDSLRLWKYQPAQLDGKPIPIHLNVTITFHLQ